MFKQLSMRLLCVSLCATLWSVGCGPDDPADSNNNNQTQPVCGNDKVETGETCDGDCPASCDDGDACTTDNAQGSAATCNLVCQNDPITMCANGDGCCPSGCDASNDDDCGSDDKCGNGMVDANETCDGNCPADATACNDNDACTTDTLSGSAATCDAVCQNDPITMCVNGDGCCPMGCTDANDDDCTASNMCGNGQIDGNETCDGNCPADAAACDDNNACTTDSLSGSAAMCDAVCQNDPITMCVNGDGCCPNNCDANNDDDCTAANLCGNGQLDANETCDGNCPTDVAACDDNNACTTDTLNGSAAMCNAMCSNVDITMCANGDGCCPNGCSNANDDDCPAANLCGNGMVDANETCDGNCPADAAACNDNDACTNDRVMGSAAMCTAFCAYDPVTMCVGGDGCCPSNCSPINDSDCQPVNLCGNGQIDGNEACDGNCPDAAACNDNNACTTDTLSGSAATCDAVCQNDPVTMCVNGDGCCPMGCTDANDNDCMAPNSCGNGILDNGETCDGNCPMTGADCNDNDACTADGVSGNPATCTSQCVNNPITVCVNNDGCCPGGCTNANDTDCAPLQPVGGACTDTAQCESFGNLQAFCLDEQNNSLPGGYCTVFSCMADMDCPQGSHCLLANNICIDSCATPQDCTRQGYTCRDPGDGKLACLPDLSNPMGADPGAPCTQGVDCRGTINGGGFCLTQNDTQWPGGTCLATGCAMDNDCPSGSHCDNGLCYDSCQSNADCTRQGYECVDFFGTGRTTCAPTSNTAANIGQACNNDPDCLGGVGNSTCIQDTAWTAGYCTSGCRSDNDCRAGSHCGYFDQNGNGFCVDACTNQNDCRAGYDCLDNDMDNNSECLPSATGNGDVGAPCANLSECGGGNNGVCIDNSNWQSGYCAINSCNAQNPCPNGSHCGFIDNATGNGTCVDSCTQNTECRPGYLCWDPDEDNTRECFPAGTGAGTVGQACLGVYECGGGTNGTCIGAGGNNLDWNMGYCAINGCNAQTGCAAGSHCGFINAATGEGLCLDSCATNNDCRAGYECFDFDGQGTAECAPSGTGNGAIGDACTGVYDCAGGQDAACFRGDAQNPVPGGYCSDECTNATCPAGSTCLLTDQTTMRSFCFDDCTNNNDCRAGYTCQTIGVDQICLPQ